MRRIYIAINLLLLLSNCTFLNTVTTTPSAVITSKPVVVPLPTTASSPSIPSEIQGGINNDPSGNHKVSGNLDLQHAKFIDIPITGTPVWISGVPTELGALFTVANSDGQLQAFQVNGVSYRGFSLSIDRLPAGMPPALVSDRQKAELIIPPDDASPFTYPILVDQQLVYISLDGNLVINNTVSQTRLDINALPDSRIITDQSGRLLVLTNPTTRYDHGVLGDEMEASGFVLIETAPTIRIAKNTVIGSPDVIEGISPIWADIDGNGTLDIIVTLSNKETGARLAVFREDGSLLAESDPIGTGYRWRHQIGVASFTENGSPLLVSVRTPHIGGIVEFFRVNNGKLELVREIKGYSTHSIGSRNLDSVLLGDFNKDGFTELLAPDQSHTNLATLSINGPTATLPLPDTLTSNLSAVTFGERLYIAAGSKGNLRIWFQE